MLGGADDVGESYEQAAARELAEERGVHAAPRSVLKFLCAGAISPYWLGLHEVFITGPVRPTSEEVAWHDWLTEPEEESLVRHRKFVPDAREAFDRYRGLSRANGPLSQVRHRLATLEAPAANRVRRPTNREGRTGGAVGHKRIWPTGPRPKLARSQSDTAIPLNTVRAIRRAKSSTGGGCPSLVAS